MSGASSRVELLCVPGCGCPLRENETFAVCSVVVAATVAGGIVEVPTVTASVRDENDVLCDCILADVMLSSGVRSSVIRDLVVEMVCVRGNVVFTLAGGACVAGLVAVGITTSTLVANPTRPVVMGGTPLLLVDVFTCDVGL